MTLLLIGIIITSASWLLSWSDWGPLSEYAFFPLWIGYILIINGISDIVFEKSLIKRMGASFLLLFLISIPLWWFFEANNAIVQNWRYLFPHPISNMRYAIQASIDFSTVVPAVLSTSFLLFRILQSRIERRQISISISDTSLGLAIVLGVFSFVLLPIFPHETFPLVWIAPILILEPLSFALGGPSLLREIQHGRYALPLSLMLATAFNGFWWEFWNYYSLPKWVYDIPYVGFWKIFEMPLLGYLGYPFFGLIVFSYTAIILRNFWTLNLIEIFEFPPEDKG